MSIVEFKLEKFRESSIEFFRHNPQLYGKYSKIFKESKITNNPNEDFSIDEMMSTLKNTYHGITCFTTTDYSDYMWKKFAENHFGFCLCFETELDTFF